jgi:uncharacterized membrane protein (UPF0127 family)
MSHLPHLPRVALELEGRPLDADVALAATFGSRMRGLAHTRQLPERAGLLITPCNSIHMVGMWYPLEAVFLSRDNRVLKVSRKLLPWLGLSGSLRARSVIEWRPGTARALGIEKGAKLDWKRSDL